MSSFIKDDFLLYSDEAREIFEVVRDLPILDYHCHLSPKEIADDIMFEDITQLSLGGDHYKWRLMRANGVKEELITGDASNYLKFEAWAETLEEAIGNPVYHWTYLEMKRYFDYDGSISKKTAKELYEHCSGYLKNSGFSAWNIFKKFKVEQIGTTDDPADSLEHHKRMREARKNDKDLPSVRPSMRPSAAMNIQAPSFAQYVKRLGEAAGISIKCYEDFLKALSSRFDFFAENGCVASDTALDPPVFEDGATDDIQAAQIFANALNGQAISEAEARIYKTRFMLWLGGEYNRLGWVMQLHIGALRGVNTLATTKIGFDTGYDSMDDAAFARPLAKILDALEKNNSLPKTILYALNPCADPMLASMIGNFQGHGVPGKIQWGSAWWFNDTKVGMENHMTILGNMGMLARFIGMTTDSRSFMSYPRHEYFRRLIANFIANLINAGEFARDLDKAKEIAKNICYFNAKKYFGF